MCVCVCVCVCVQVDYVRVSRDPERSPMQWDDTPQAGFTNSSHPWLPIHPDYPTVNVQVRQKHAVSNNHCK